MNRWITEPNEKNIELNSNERRQAVLNNDSQ